MPDDSEGKGTFTAYGLQFAPAAADSRGARQRSGDKRSEMERTAKQKRHNKTKEKETEENVM